MLSYIRINLNNRFYVGCNLQRFKWMVGNIIIYLIRYFATSNKEKIIMIFKTYDMLQDMLLFGEDSVGLGSAISPKKKDLYVNCECDSEILRITKWEDEDEFYLTVYEYSPSSISLTPSLLRRISMAFDLLRGKKIKTKELIISKENFNKIKKFK